MRTERRWARATGRQGISVRWDEREPGKEERCLERCGFISLNTAAGQRAGSCYSQREKSVRLEEVGNKAIRAGCRCADAADDARAVGGLRRSAPRKEAKGGAPAAHPPPLPCPQTTLTFSPAWSSPPPAGSVAHLHPTEHPAAKALCLPVRCHRCVGFTRNACGGTAVPRPPRTCRPKAGTRAACRQLGSAARNIPAGKRARRLRQATGSSSSPALFFFLGQLLKLVNTWTRLTKHSSRRKWGVCRNTPLHIVMADINSMLITLCTFQSHILKPFR